MVCNKIEKRPLFDCVVMMDWKHPVSHQLLFFSLLNTVMLHPACPDGKNITASIKEMKERKR
ncbi:hypothetical protein [Bacillus safensis]|uniref:hypothetical protein n=1 Tax=Bacillus safensis TaxID=561879 RepID=UPI001F4DE637|nr:hypothetical protein [Bacillus safensis]